MCDHCHAAGTMSDDNYRCHGCGHVGRTDPEKPGHCVECGHDMREQYDELPPNLLHG